MRDFWEKDKPIMHPSTSFIGKKLFAFLLNLQKQNNVEPYSIKVSLFGSTNVFRSTFTKEQIGNAMNISLAIVTNLR